MTENQLVGWHHRLDGYEFEQILGVGDRQGGLAFCSPWGSRVGHDWVTELNWTERRVKKGKGDGEVKQTSWCFPLRVEYTTYSFNNVKFRILQSPDISERVRKNKICLKKEETSLLPYISIHLILGYYQLRELFFFNVIYSPQRQAISPPEGVTLLRSITSS